MQVRAKFKCDSVTQHSGGVAQIKLTPVMSGSDENKTFYKYSPSGSIDLGCCNPTATAEFEPGKEYYIDFTKAGE